MHSLVDVFNSVERFRRGKFGILDRTEDPTFLTFSVDFIFETIPNDFFGFPSNPLFAEDGSYSAYQYFKALGLYPNADRIKEFSKILKDITYNKPWYFQSITGLNKLWAATTNPSQNYKGKDLTIEFETLEAIDLKMGYMADLYRSAVYDGLFMREMLPENLRKFEMHIYVAEFRNFSNLIENIAFNAITKAAGDNVSNIASKALGLIRSNSDYFEKNVTFLKFNCQLCEFDFSETFPGGDKLNAHTPEMAVNKFKVKVDWFMEQNSYTLHDIMTKDYYAKYKETEDQWKKKRNLTLNGIAGAVSTLFQAGTNIAKGVSDLKGMGGGDGKNTAKFGHR
jgi:hypothetical protein